MAKPAQGCTYISAYTPNEPATGCATVISPSAHIKHSAIAPAARKLKITPGPASLTEMALPRNNPVPIAPPIAIMESCRGVKWRWRPASRPMI